MLLLTAYVIANFLFSIFIYHSFWTLFTFFCAKGYCVGPGGIGKGLAGVVFGFSYREMAQNGGVREDSKWTIRSVQRSNVQIRIGVLLLNEAVLSSIKVISTSASRDVRIYLQKKVISTWKFKLWHVTPKIIAILLKYTNMRSYPRLFTNLEICFFPQSHKHHDHVKPLIWFYALSVSIKRRINCSIRRRQLRKGNHLKADSIPRRHFVGFLSFVAKN